jgi:hypothetical protein
MPKKTMAELEAENKALRRRRAPGPRDSLLKKLEGLGGVGGASPRQRYEAVLQTKEESKAPK